MGTSLLVESWTWYAVGSVVFLLRLLARALHFGGPHKLKIEDALITFAFACYTGETVFMNIIVKEQSNLIPKGYLKTHVLTPADIEDREYGSKITLVVEQCQIFTIWLIKACLLLMYYRLTKDAYPKHNLAVKILGAYVAFGFVFMEIFYFGVWCRPFNDYWAVPTPNPKQCAAAWNHLITNAVFNISSDLAMVIIGLSIALFLNFPPRRKYALLMLISMGLFVIACAAANKAYSFTNPYGSQWTFWYIREASTAVLIANLPYVFTLFRRLLGFKDIPTSNRSRRGSSGAVKNPSRLWCIKKDPPQDDNDSTFARMPSVPELAYYSPGRSKYSDYDCSPNKNAFFNQSRSGSERAILGKADALALEDLDQYETPSSRKSKSSFKGLSPLVSPRYSSSDPLHNPKALEDAAELRPNSNYTSGSEDANRTIHPSERITALPPFKH